MKKISKAIIMAIPALAVALAVGATTMGCGDTSTQADISTQVTDMSTPASSPDLKKASD